MSYQDARHTNNPHDPFICVICEHEQKMEWEWSPRDFTIPPICRHCESDYSRSVPAVGCFADRRAAMRLSALAEALCGTAYSIEWSSRYGQA